MFGLACLLGLVAIFWLLIVEKREQDEPEFTDWADWDWPVPEDNNSWDFPAWEDLDGGRK